MRSLSFFVLLAFCAGCSSPKPAAVAQNAATLAPQIKNGPQQLNWTILGAFPHDSKAFTQGLLWHDGALYESTGQNGQSSLRRVDLQSGQVLEKRELGDQFFAEGLALAGDRLYQLTWQSKTGFVYDLKTLKPQAKFAYGNEGWGLTFDGKNLVQSDGSDVLTWRDPKNFAALRRLKITDDGVPLRQLNELEWIDGKIWANVWQTDLVVVIDPQSGKVESKLDLSGLLPVSQRTGNEDVLNGIAYDSEQKRLFVTGKYWPKLFWIGVN